MAPEKRCRTQQSKTKFSTKMERTTSEEEDVTEANRLGTQRKKEAPPFLPTSYTRCLHVSSHGPTYRTWRSTITNLTTNTVTHSSHAWENLEPSVGHGTCIPAPRAYGSLSGGASRARWFTSLCLHIWKISWGVWHWSSQRCLERRFIYKEEMKQKTRVQLPLDNNEIVVVTATSKEWDKQLARAYCNKLTHLREWNNMPLP